MGSRESGKSKYSPEVHAKIVKNLQAGAFKTHAAQAAGISHHTLDVWLKWGREGREPYAQFAEDCEQAIAEDAVRNHLVITKAALGPIEGDWKAAAWLLERKFPDLYGQIAALRALTGGEKPFSPWKAAPNTKPQPTPKFDA